MRTNPMNLSVMLAATLTAMVAVGCSSPPTDEGAAAASDEALSTKNAPWCNSGHTADSEEGDFNGFGGRSCTDASAKASCHGLGGRWCKGYVDVQYLFCACQDTSAGVATKPRH